MVRGGLSEEAVFMLTLKEFEGATMLRGNMYVSLPSRDVGSSRQHDRKDGVHSKKDEGVEMNMMK